MVVVVVIDDVNGADVVLGVDGVVVVDVGVVVVVVVVDVEGDVYGSVD